MARTSLRSYGKDYDFGGHKYRDENGALDRKGQGYYKLKETWESSGVFNEAHTGLSTQLTDKVLPKKFEKVASIDTLEPERILARQVPTSVYPALGRALLPRSLRVRAQPSRVPPPRAATA